MEQVFVAITGIAAICLKRCCAPRHKKYVCLFVLAGWPVWFFSAWQAGQLGFVVLCALGLLDLLVAVYRYWVRPFLSAFC